MDFNLITNIESCYFDIPALLYYSHIPTAIVMFLLGLFVYARNKELLSANLLFFVALFFSLWVAGDMIIWISPDSRMVMFWWSLINLFEVVVSMSTLYFAYTFLERKDAPFWAKLSAAGLLLPFMLLIPTEWNISGFDTVSCEANQGGLIDYFYFLEGLFSFSLVVYLVQKVVRTSKEYRKQAIVFSLGVILFLVSFSGANIIASITDDWHILQYGLVGAPLFATFLAFLIVRYQAFNVKLLGAQALVAGLILLIGSQFFFVEELNGYLLVGVTIFLAIIFGIILIRSVQQEVKRKEELQEISDRLAVANTELHRLDNAKSEFISIASHQLRTPLTAIKGFISLLLEGAYGTFEPAVGDTLNKVYLANNRLMSLVENLLNISRIEAGRIQYQFVPTRLEDIILELRDIFLMAAHEKGLKLVIELPKEPLPMLSIDGQKIREVVSNVMDNSIKYTEKGEITVAVRKQNEKIIITVSDTGVGIDADDLPHLFKKFERGKDAAQVNVSSTGLGLYVGKSFIEAHDGAIRAESAGKGQGARFIMELPIQSDRLEKKP
ncbi:MAG: ATP-binding protein [Candidatus Moraniibacteriota bacterium]